MQIRKLIRLLQEKQKKVGPYAKVAIDARSYKHFHSCWDFDHILSVDLESCETVDADGWRKEHAQERPIIVLNKYE